MPILGGGMRGYMEIRALLDFLCIAEKAESRRYTVKKEQRHNNRCSSQFYLSHSILPSMHLINTVLPELVDIVPSGILSERS